MIDDLRISLTNLHEPAPPAALKATVMARIARKVDERQMVEEAAMGTARHRRERPVWLWALVLGVAVVVAGNVYAWLIVGSLPNVASPKIGGGGLSLIPTGAPAILIGLGLFLYLAGLFAPLRATSRRI